VSEPEGSAVKRAKRTLPRDIKQYTGCSRALKKELRKRT